MPSIPDILPARRRASSGARTVLAALLSAGTACAWADSARAGAWTQPRGHYYVRIGVAGIDTRSRFDATGGLVPYDAAGSSAASAPGETRYRGRELRGYAEYGVFDRLTAYGSTAYKSLALEERTLRRETSGFGDLHLGARLRISGPRSPVSLSGEARLPLGYSTDENPSLGAGEADVALRLLAGASRGRLYATADGGFAWRGGGFQDQFLASLEGGGRFFGMYGGRVVLRWERSVELATAGAGDAAGFDPALQSPRLLTIDGVINLEILPGLELEAGISHALSGRNALAGNTLEVALVGFGAAGATR